MKMKDNRLRIIGILLALLMVLGVANLQVGEASTTAYQQVVASAPTGGTLQAIPVPDTQEALTGSVGSYGAVAHAVDAQSRLWLVYGNLNPGNSNQTWAEVHIYGPGEGGPLLEEYIVYPAPDFKIDSLDITYSCPAAKIALTTHSFTGVRRRQVEESPPLPGFVCSGSQAQTLSKVGGPNAYTPIEQSGGGGAGGLTDADLTAIRGLVHSEVQDAMHTVVDNIIPKTTLAINNTKVLTLGNIYTSDGLYNRIAETSYQSAVNALIFYGAAKLPIPTPTPHP